MTSDKHMLTGETDIQGSPCWDAQRLKLQRLSEAGFAVTLRTLSAVAGVVPGLANLLTCL